MSYSSEQIVEKGRQPRYGKGKSVRFIKKSRHKWMRQRMKDPEFIPKHNRYTAGWFD